jgi:hypothetical protein
MQQLHCSVQIKSACRATVKGIPYRLAFRFNYRKSQQSYKHVKSSCVLKMREGFAVVLALLQYKAYCYGICSFHKIAMDSNTSVLEASDFQENVVHTLIWQIE